MIETAVSGKGVTKVFGSGPLAFHALKGVDLEVARGELMMLAGPSGSGKTTLLSIFGCVLSPSAGRVEIFGEDVSARRESEMPRLRLSYIGFVFQGHNLLASMTAEENVAFQLQLRGWKARDARREAGRLLERVGLGDKVDRKPEDLSGGQRQRIAIARAVAGAPPLILADEPTASLDAKSGLSVTEMLKELARERGHTVIVVTHHSRIFHLADRLVHLEDGRIVSTS
jgi:putative ABC transport system ATP-binding protein